MILVDTNVVSEIMKVAPLTNVLNWLNLQKSRDLYVSTITLGEIEYGLRILPDGKRRLQLKVKIRTIRRTGLCPSCPTL